MAKLGTRHKRTSSPAKKRTPPRPRAKADTGLTQRADPPKLTEAQQTAVVQRLAMFDSPQTVVGWVKEEFAIEISRQAIHHYDPTVGDKPAEKWCQLFDATRAAFLKSTADIPIANRSVRLRRLERMALAAERLRNFALAAQLHEQAAKEVGDVYTNRTKVALTDPDGENPFVAGVKVTIESSTPTSDAQPKAP